MITLVVQKERLRHNLMQIKSVVGRSRIIAIVKGNGYGLGLVEYAKVLRDSGISIFGVSRLEEAIQLRQAGITEDIILLSSTQMEQDVANIIHYKIIAAVGSYESAVLLNGLARQNKTVARVHIKMDTGFGRSGFLQDETDKVIQIARFMDNLRIEGIFTHLSDSFGKKQEHVRSQYDEFCGVLTMLSEAKVNYGMVHIANSCGALRYSYLHTDAVRIGSALLGRLPIKDKWNLQRVGHIVCEVSEVRWLPKGHNIGYANVYTTKRPVRVAIIPVGYADGFGVEKSRDTFRGWDILRYLWNDFKLFFNKKGFTCEISDRRAQILGRVSLTHVVADVTDIPCEAGSLATFDVNPLLVDGSVERTYV